MIRLLVKLCRFDNTFNCATTGVFCVTRQVFFLTSDNFSHTVKKKKAHLLLSCIIWLMKIIEWAKISRVKYTRDAIDFIHLNSGSIVLNRHSIFVLKEQLKSNYHVIFQYNVALCQFFIVDTIYLKNMLQMIVRDYVVFTRAGKNNNCFNHSFLKINKRICRMKVKSNMADSNSACQKNNMGKVLFLTVFFVV